MIDYGSEVVAGALEFSNVLGRRILGVTGEGPAGAPRGTVVLVPGYQQRIHHLALLSRSLVRHGYRTVRFDLTNHVGHSEGEVADLSMSSMACDADAVLSECADRWVGPLFVVATSLGARAVVRALTSGSTGSVTAAVLVLPVVDVEYTINEAVERDVFDEWRSGRHNDPLELSRVIDHDVRYHFVRDAIESGFAGVEGTIDEISRIHAPIRAIAAERDDWVRPADVEAAMSSRADADRRIVVLSATSHELSHNPPVMRLLLEQIVTGLDPYSQSAPAAVDHLSFEEVVDTVHHERAWTRQAYRHLASGRPLESVGATSGSA